MKNMKKFWKGFKVALSNISIQTSETNQFKSIQIYAYKIIPTDWPYLIKRKKSLQKFRGDQVNNTESSNNDIAIKFESKCNPDKTL